MLHIADVLEATDGSSFRELPLDKVFVPQDVRKCDEIDPALLELPDEMINLLREQKELFVDGELQFARRSKYEQVKPRSVMALLNDASIRLATILGDPGSGKTSALRWYAIQLALSPRDERDNMYFPIIVELKQFAAAKTTNQLTLLDFIAQGGSVEWAIDKKALLSFFQSSQQRVLLMLDGLDEIFDPSFRLVIISEIATFANVHNQPTTRIIVTSRLVGFRLTDLVTFSLHMLNYFDTTKINIFLKKWHDSTYSDLELVVSDARKSRLKLAIQKIPSIAILAKNPLLLTMIAMVNRSPELSTKRVRLYEKCAELLIGRWKVQESVDAYFETTEGNISVFDYAAKSSLLKDLANRMQQNSTKLGNVMDQDSLNDVFDKHVRIRFKRSEPNLRAF